MDFAASLANASPTLLLALLIVAVGMGRWVVLARELRTSESRLVEMKIERDEWKTIALRELSRIESRVAAVVQEE